MRIIHVYVWNSGADDVRLFRCLRAANKAYTSSNVTKSSVLDSCCITDASSECGECGEWGEAFRLFRDSHFENISIKNAIGTVGKSLIQWTHKLEETEYFFRNKVREVYQVVRVTWSVFRFELLMKPRNCNSALARVNLALQIRNWNLLKSYSW